MFEGVVSQVLAGYLGRYIKGIQKDQLKIGLWSEEVLLEKVELILEAFDYLQLPFALHNGRVGKLSIRIPWKKLGWEPIIVVLEDVFICACQREDSEWGKESVEKRELAGKMAKLNAVELAKFSKCVADNQAGQSFISYISAKILDSIQVSVRNVHIVYIDSNNNLEKFMFGLRFSSLTVMTDPRKHNATASATGKFRGSQVNKIVEISNVGVHCNSLRNSNDFLENGDADNSRFQCNAKLDSGGYDYLVNPFDVTVSIVVNKTVKGDGAPQYAINSELNTLMISLNEIQLQQILCLWDHFAVCKLREKYGRYRPPYKSLIEKCNGWKRMWWHYAQESVLADVRKKLWRTSWRNFGSRINHRHKYVNLYRKKLELLQHDQVIDKDILEELEKMDKECDIDDILSYRSIAEQQLQELHLSSRNITSGTTESTVAQEKQLFGERPSGGARGWLNWLSLGMLGAGGTADSNSFAGVISDDIVKDIYEATEFHPVHTLNDDSCRRDEFTLVSLRSSINQIVVLISSKKSDRTVAEIILGGIGSECKYRDGSASILLLIDSTKITDPCNENVILTSKVELSEGSSLKGVPPFIGMLVKMPTSDQKSEQSVKVELQPFEVTYDPHFFLAILQFYDLWSSFQFQHNRVLESLNRLDNFSTRLLAKAEYIVYTRGRLNWDVTLHGIIMRLPLKSENYEDLLMGGAVSFRSKVMQENGFGTFNNSYSNNFMMKTFEANSASCRSLISKDLYDHFEIELSAFEVNLSKHCVSEVVSIVKRFKASFVYGLCIFLDEPMLTKLAVDCVVPSVVMHFSKEIFDALVEAFDKCSIGKANQVVGSVLDSTKIDKAEYLSPFRFFLSVKSDCCCFHVDLEDAAESSQTASFTLGCIGIGCSLQEHLDFWILVKVMKIDALNLKSETDTNILCSLTSCSDNKVQVEYDGPISAPVTCEGSPCAEGCFELHYQVTRDGGIVNHWYHLSISDIELHIHPRFFGLLQNLVHIIEQRVRSASYVKRTVGLHQDNKMGFTKYSRFGFSNFSHTESGISTGIAIENFPFLTVCNSGLFTNFGGFLDPNTHELKRLYANDKSYTRSEKLNAKKRCRTKNCSMMKHEFCPDSIDPSISASYVSLFMVDVNFNQLRVHFHDSSCILGTVTVPVSMCSFTFEGADCWDVLISVDDLLLSSSWTPSNIQQSLWGPVSSGAPSVLNVRVRKELREAMYPVTEISIGVQHVLCILPSEYLAMVIGYFSLPDWTAKESGQSTSRNAEFVNLENTQFTILYKVEVLDSAVILPLKNIADQFLHLGLPQAYCSFIPTSNLSEANRDIPPECMITDTKLADRTDAINIFVRGTSLCLMLPDVNEFPLKFDWSKSMRSVPIISELDAGLWIRIPCGTQSSEGSAFPTSIMMKADVCNLTAEAEYFSTSLDAVARVIDQLSAVGKESEFFHIDVFQFLQLKRHSKGIDDIVGAVSNGSLINVRSCITALSVKLSHLQTLGSSSPVVAKADMKLNFFTILRNEIPQIIDVNISALTLHSFKNSALLASFSPDDTVFSPLSINFSTLDNDKDELVLSVPCFDIWLYLSDWNEVIDLLSLYSLASNSTSSTTSGCSRPLGQTQVVSKSETFSCAVPECNLEDNVILTLKTENCLVSFYLPVCDKEEQLDNPGVTKTREVLPSFEATNKRLLKFTLHTKYTELSVGGNHVKLESRLEKLRALLETIQNDEVISVPLIQISHVRMGTEICRRAESIENVFVEAGIETLDVGLSYQIIQFWSSTLFKFPETASSQISWPNMAIEVCLKKGALLLSDGRWSPHGPILEILMHDMLVKFKQTEDVMEGSITMDLSINYNNIDKVVWEPFIEPWSFHSNFIRKDGSSVLSMSRMTQIYVSSTRQLNLNITEPLVEACFRVNQLIKDATSQNGANELYGGFGTFGFQQADNIHTRRYAPYILHNDTSLPLLFQVSHGPSNKDDVHSFSLPMEDGSLVLPGFSVPIYVEETLDEQVSRHSRVQSSGRLLDKKLSSVVHHMITIQLDGTSQPSKPMSMDLVGLRFFEVNFSNYIPSATVEIERDANASRYTRKSGEQYKTEPNGLVVPVAFEVSMYQYSKMIRLYSTVLLFNATSVPLEIRFDIPFGVSPKILDPILPGQESPLPLHLAEAGRIRWRPAGTSYLWSETHSLSNILSQGNKDGFLKPFVCYPTHPNSNPFRCCISVQDFSVSSAGARKHSSLDNDANEGPVITTSDQSTQNSDIKKKQCIRQVRLTTPLLVKNYLPVDLSLRVDIGGVTHSVFVSKGDAASVHYVDSTHELRITFDMQGFRPTSSKFPRAESFSAMSKPNGSKFSLSEILTLNSISSDGPVSVTLEKAMDSFSGAREICLTVPYLLYNCTGFSLMIIDGSHETKARPQVIPSSYYLCGQEQLLSGKRGLASLSTEADSLSRPLEHDNFLDPLSTSRSVSSVETTDLYSDNNPGRSFTSRIPWKQPLNYCNKSEPDVMSKYLSCSNHTVGEISPSNLTGNIQSECGLQNPDDRKAVALMYAPAAHNSSTENLVKLCASLPPCRFENASDLSWSSSFSLVPASGSASVTIPRPWDSGAFLISVASVPVAGELPRRTRAITFQPRYIICNVCNRDLCYKQKGANCFYRLRAGQHSHLHWSDTTRELLVSVRFNEPGWQWSGGFLPDCLGDTQVKMLNYVSGELNMVRAEVRNADLALSDQNVIRSADGNSMTQLILLSDDSTGFMPYRIDNFSVERLRIYQQKCANFESSVNPYTSSQYAWDEPCCPHRLVVEVPGERILGTYSLDDVREYPPIFLPSTSEKPERKFRVSIHAEGAVKVLSIVDLNCHIMKDMKETGFLGLKERTVNQKQQRDTNFSEMISIHLPFVGVSLINSSAQELIFASLRDTNIVLFQSLDQQKFSLQILSLQIDNQLLDTLYPIMLSFDNEQRGRPGNRFKNKENFLRIHNDNISPSSSDGAMESTIYLSIAKWRKMDPSLLSFKYVNLWFAPMCIELEEQFLISLFDFSRSVSSRLHCRTLQKTFQLQTIGNTASWGEVSPPNIYDSKSRQHSLLGVPECVESNCIPLLPSIYPIGAPWQQIYLLARRQKKIYIEAFELAPIKLSVSFSSTPWMIRNGNPAEVEPFARISHTIFQRGLMTLIDVEGVPVHLRQLRLEHLMASRESIQEILLRHYTWQLLHEIYKVFGSAGVIGNPMGFARNVGLGIKDFLSVSGKGIVQSPGGLFTGVAQGSKRLVGSTIYAISSATTQFSKAAHKGIVVFALDEHAVTEMDGQQKTLSSRNKGLLNEFLEGLTGLLQSPIRGAEKHGLPGVLSGIVMGTAGLVARPMASILEATGKAAQSIRNRSSPHQSNCFRGRLPRPLARELPLLPYSWEEAIGYSMLLQADGSRLRDELFAMCKELKQEGKFVIITERLILIVQCFQLIGFRAPEFTGVAADPGWIIETEMSLESVVHIDREGERVNVVGSNLPSRQKKFGARNRPWSPPISAPLYQISVELPNELEAKGVLQVLVSTIERGKETKKRVHVLQRSNLR